MAGRHAGRRGKRTGKSEQDRMARVMDELSEFEEFKQKFLRRIQEALKQGKDSKEILDMAKAMAAGRLATTVVLELDSQRATAAAKDILDRTDGRAKETKEVTHKFDKLADEELDSLVMSLAEQDENEQEKEVH